MVLGKAATYASQKALYPNFLGDTAVQYKALQRSGAKNRDCEQEKHGFTGTVHELIILLMLTGQNFGIPA